FELRNRVIMGAMHTGIEKLDNPLERIAAFYRERIEGEVAMIMTGGVAPCFEGRLEENSPYIGQSDDLAWHQAIVETASDSRTLMCMQLLHGGRYAQVAECVAPSPLQATINPHAPRALST